VIAAIVIGLDCILSLIGIGLDCISIGIDGGFDNGSFLIDSTWPCCGLSTSAKHSIAQPRGFNDYYNSDVQLS
jgi:hypothetical protein